MKRKELSITTEKQFISLREEISDFIAGEQGAGMVHIFVAHTTCGIKIMEGELLLLSDVNEYLSQTWPEDGSYRHDIISIRDVPIDERINGFAHMRQLFFSCEASVPCQDGKMMLGKWQDVFLVEFDPIRERKVIFTYCGE